MEFLQFTDEEYNEALNAIENEKHVKMDKSEKYYGIQSYDNPVDAFETMDQLWGECAAERETNLVLGEKEFFDQIYDRVVLKYAEYKNGKITKDEVQAALNMSPKCTTDYLLDFNFFFYCNRTKTFYTSRMEFKDDNVHVWNDDQWHIYYEIIEAYQLNKYIALIVRHIEDYMKKEGIKILEDGYLYDDLLWNDKFGVYAEWGLGKQKIGPNGSTYFERN